MNNENKRFKELRGTLQLSQEAFGDAIGLSKSGISNIENGIRKVTDQHIKLICSEFNVTEEWIRDGSGEMLVQQTEFSLDGYAEKNKISPLEIDIIKSYMEVDENIRKGIISHFKEVFARHAETAASAERNIDAEVESYRRELLAEEKGATLSVSDELKGKSM